MGTLVTTFGPKRDEYGGAFSNVIAMDDLFRQEAPHRYGVTPPVEDVVALVHVAPGVEEGAPYDSIAESTHVG